MNSPIRILLVKPYQAGFMTICQPPLGLLYLGSSLRERFGAKVDVSGRDLRLYRKDPVELAEEIGSRYDLVGISALNCEAEAAAALARAIREISPGTVIALGGPYGRTELARGQAAFDWVFSGEGERTLQQAVAARFFGEGDLRSIPGLAWRAGPGEPFTLNGGEDLVPDLDALPMPAWDQVPFDVYARRHNMNGSLRAERYAPLFTSRGCPYKCGYCHNLFGSGIRWRSADSVMEEIDLLYKRYKVREFQIVDDIFNLDRERMREIAKKVIARYGRRELFFTFPNGVRGDIIDDSDLPLLRDMGVYDITFAVETASARLQKLINKNLDVARVNRTINAAVRAGMSTKGFFMLGFPTETPEELESTVRFAEKSRLTIAHFFFVIPQPGTPLYSLAMNESARALELAGTDDYYAKQSWYQLAYNFDLAGFRRKALLRFYLRPGRLLRVFRRTNLNQLLLGEWSFMKLTALRGRSRETAPALEGEASD